MIETDYIFGKRKSATEEPAPYNITVGGLTHWSKADFAARFLDDSTGFAIPEADITYFNINGDTVEMFVNKEAIKIKDYAFQNGVITFFKDHGGIVKEAWTRAFFNCEFLYDLHLPAMTHLTGYFVAETEKLGYLHLPSVTTQHDGGGAGGGRGTRTVDDSKVYIVDLPSLVDITGQFAFLHDGSSRKLQENVYLPSVRTIRGLGNDLTFDGIKSGAKYYFDPYLQTCNGGAEEGDVSHIRAQGGTVVYIQNFTKPSNITDLAHAGGGVLTFTPPVSTNALDQYLVFKNGIYLQKIAGSGATLSNLLPGDTIELRPYDIYFNRSTSNIITI